MRIPRAGVESDVVGPVERAWRLLLGRADSSAPERYGVALALAFGALLVGSLLPSDLQPYRVLVSCMAVFLAALRAGAGPAWLALAVCAVPYAGATAGGRPWLGQPDPLRRLLLFGGFAGLSVWAGSGLRDGVLHLVARRRHAERRADVQRVAAELGVRALAESDLDALLSETLQAVYRALGCEAVALLELVPGGDALRLRERAGDGREPIGATFGPAEAPLAFRALAAREPLSADLSWESGRDAAREPGRAPRPRSVAPASVVAPIVAPGPGGRSFGVLAATSRTRRRFSADEASFLQSAANVVGTAVVRFQGEERARRHLAAARFLADASRELALSMDFEETLGRVARLAVPFLADWCAVAVLDADGRPRALVGEAGDPVLARAVREALPRYPIDPGAEHGVGRILRTGAPELLPETTPEAFAGEGPTSAVRREILQGIGLRSFMGAPLAIGDRCVGALAFGAAGGRRFGAEDLALAQALADRCAVALDHAELYRAAQAATHAREEVLAVVSHDLKSPLNALLVGAQVVERRAPVTPDGDDLRRAAQGVRRAAQRMLRLVNDLVDVASLDAGAPSLRLGDHDANGIAREAFETVRGVWVERDVALQLSVAEPGPLSLRCDRDRLLQVLGNLLSNALQVSPPGGRVELRAARAAGEVVFTVSDRGPGIPPADLPRLFERWYRGRARYPGSGLGLAIARALVEAHGGRIWAESEEGRGSDFRVALPAGGPPAPEAAGPA